MKSAVLVAACAIQGKEECMIHIRASDPQTLVFLPHSARSHSGGSAPSTRAETRSHAGRQADYMLDMINAPRVLPRYNHRFRESSSYQRLSKSVDIIRVYTIHVSSRGIACRAQCRCMHRFGVPAHAKLHTHDKERLFTWYAFRRSNFFNGLISFQVVCTCMTTVALNLLASQAQKQCFMISGDRHYKVRLHWASVIDLERQHPGLCHIWSVGVAIHFLGQLAWLIKNQNNVIRAISRHWCCCSV